MLLTYFLNLYIYMSKENIRIFSCVCAESALFDMKLLAWSKAWGEAPSAGKLGKL